MMPGPWEPAPVPPAGAMAREVFGLDPHGTYMPHLSLLYSDVSLPERCAAPVHGRCRLHVVAGARLLHASASFAARQPGYPPSKYMNTRPFPSLCRERIAVEMQACLLDDPEGLPDRRFEADVLAVWSTPAADKELRTWHAVAELPLRQAG